jgi:hypothetical protein
MENLGKINGYNGCRYIGRTIGVYYAGRYLHVDDWYIAIHSGKLSHGTGIK